MRITQDDVHMVSQALHDLGAIGPGQAITTNILSSYLLAQFRELPKPDDTLLLVKLFQPGSTAAFAPYCRRYGARDRRWFIPT